MTAETPPAVRPTGSRRVLGSLVVIAVLVVGLFAIGAFQALTACACSQPPTPGAYPPSPVEGVVVAVDSSGLGRVAGFTLRVPGGASFPFELGVLENATEFSPSHLAEHMASSQPIRVFFRVEDGRGVAYRLEDAAG